MSRNPLRIVVAATLYMLGLGWIVNSNSWSGPTLIRLTESHGVHMNDWLTFALWTLAVAVICPAFSAGSWRGAKLVDDDRFGLTPLPGGVRPVQMGYSLNHDRAEDLSTRGSVLDRH